MYINKGIYTYIPNPEPETPKPQQHPRQQSEQLFGLLSQAAGRYQEAEVPRAACLVVSALVQ